MTVSSLSLPHSRKPRVSTARARVEHTPRQVGLLKRLFGRKTPTLYQRCLAVHILSAGERGALR
jgi:hypothetical protein